MKTTINGYPWTVGVKQIVLNPSDKLCHPAGGVFHFYDSSEIAILMNPIHADITNPKLWKVEIDKVVVHDGTKGGCHEMTLIEELPIPKITTTQKVAFGIYCAMSFYKDESFTTWANDWLSGKDRSIPAARYAADAAARYAAAGENFLIEFVDKATRIS